MVADPFRRFLGIDEGAGPLALLGLVESPRDRLPVETALRDRLGQVFRHPDGRSADAERVREALRRAAALLIDRGPRGAAAAPALVVKPPTPPSSPPRGPGRSGPTLTEFDRNALAVLVGCGGWNRRSRAQLVALASANRVTARGLMTVIAGLSDYARAGGARLGMAEITSGGGRFVGPALAPRGPGAAGLAPGTSSSVRRLTDRWMPELTDDSPASTVKLSLLFATLTLLFAALFIRAVISGGEDASRPAPDPPRLRPAPTPARAGQSPPSAPAASVLALARTRPLPTFLGNALPSAATDAADETPRLLDDLDIIVRKLSISGDPSEAVFHSWSVTMGAIAAGWVLHDDSTRRALERGIDEVLRETVDAPSAGERLLESLVPARGRLAEPLDVWRGAWRAGTLAALGANRALPPSVTERARGQLAVTLGERAAGSVDFTSAAEAWLEITADGLVDILEFERRSYDFWEMWLAAQRKLGGGRRLDGAVMRVVARILATGTDLARPGPSVNVLGRMLTLADFESSAVVRDFVGGLFDGEDASPHDLWVFTSLLAQMDTAPWFGPRLVLPDDAGRAFRRRIRDRIAAAWPELAGESDPAEGRRHALRVDPRDRAEWIDLRGRAGARPLDSTDDALMALLVATCRLNESAVMLAVRRRADAASVMDLVARALSDAAGPDGRGANVSAAVHPAAAVGQDGEWSRAYGEARRNTEERLRSVRVLRTQAGGDLGPIDSEIFVREVYRGSPQEIRSLARAVLVERFTAGRAIAMELLDQFPDAPRTRGVSEIIRRLTGRLLPPTRGENWSREARLALLHHALELHPRETGEIDRWAVRLRESLAARAAALGLDPAAAAAVRTPRAAAALLSTVWRDRAAMAMSGDPVPDDLDGLARRQATRLRLAEGPVQALVAEQVTILEHLAYFTVAEQPEVRGAVQAIVAVSAERRARAAGVLVQAIEAERSIGQLWGLRLGVGSGLPPGSIPGEGTEAERSPRGAGGRLGVTVTLGALVSIVSAQVAGPDAADTWRQRLEALRPERPMAYLELAEEVADAGLTRADRTLARHLFGLAGALDTDHLGRSACLGLADLAEKEPARRRLLALASLLGDDDGARGPAGEGGLADEYTLTAALAVTEAFSHYRRGRGPQALAALRRPGAGELLEQCGRLLPGGAHRFLEDCKLYRGNLRPNVSGGHLVLMLRLEVGLLAGDGRPWSSDLLLGGGAPLIEVDPDRVTDTLGTDGTRPLYRGGWWVGVED